MRKRNGNVYRTKSEARRFRVTLTALREELGWNQGDLAARVGVSVRTVSNWENGYWLPPEKQRLHVLLALRDVPPAYVLQIAETLGLTADPAHASLLQPFRDALAGVAERPPVANVAPPRPPRVDGATLKRAIDAAVREVSDALDAKPNDVRAGVSRVLAACRELGGTIEDAHAALRASRKG
jgi:transcriptional regulator with XRE-family HTH domain